MADHDIINESDHMRYFVGKMMDRYHNIAQLLKSLDKNAKIERFHHQFPLQDISSQFCHNLTNEEAKK